MTTTIRFDNAVRKLYTAFHSNTLNPEDCKQCAVGHILDKTDQWKHMTDIHGTIRLNYIGRVHQNLGRKFHGYSPIELLQIEAAFLKGCGYRLGQSFCHKPDYSDNNILFHGLCKVISKLCELDCIKNVMDCRQLFAFETEISSHQNPNKFRVKI